MNGLLFGIILTLSWNPGDSTHTGFYLKYGTKGVYENIIDVKNVTTYTKDYTFSAPNKNCFVVTAYNLSGESLPSNEICANVPGKPGSLQLVVNPVSSGKN